MILILGILFMIRLVFCRPLLFGERFKAILKIVLYPLNSFQSSENILRPVGVTS